MKMGINADRQTALDRGWEIAETWLLDTGEALDGEGNPDARELASRKAEVMERLGKAWDDAATEYTEVAMEAFIEEHREELVAAIAAAGYRGDDLDDDGIEQWILNDEGLYNWAKSEGAIE